MFCPSYKTVRTGMPLEVRELFLVLKDKDVLYDQGPVTLLPLRACPSLFSLIKSSWKAWMTPSAAPSSLPLNIRQKYSFSAPSIWRPKWPIWVRDDKMG